MSNRKEDILETATKLFNEKGCMKTSTRHIADELGINVGNIYYYFKNKEEIIIYIYETYMESISGFLKSIKMKLMLRLTIMHYFLIKWNMKKNVHF